jgi:hypothetical protein
MRPQPQLEGLGHVRDGVDARHAGAAREGMQGAHHGFIRYPVAAYAPVEEGAQGLEVLIGLRPEDPQELLVRHELTFVIRQGDPLGWGPIGRGHLPLHLWLRLGLQGAGPSRPGNDLGHRLPARSRRGARADAQAVGPLYPRRNRHRPPLRLGRNQLGQEPHRLRDQGHQLGSRLQVPLDDPIEQPLTRLSELRHALGAHQPAAALEGMEAPPQGRQGLLVSRVGAPTGELLGRRGGLIASLLEEDVEELLGDSGPLLGGRRAPLGLRSRSATGFRRVAEGGDYLRALDRKGLQGGQGLAATGEQVVARRPTVRQPLDVKLERRDGVRQQDELLIPGPLLRLHVAPADQGSDGLREMTRGVVAQDLEGTGDVGEQARHLAEGRRAPPLIVAGQDGLLDPCQLAVGLLQRGGAQLRGEDPGKRAGALGGPAAIGIGLEHRFDPQQLRRQGFEPHRVLPRIGHGQVAEPVGQVPQTPGQAPRVGHVQGTGEIAQTHPDLLQRCAVRALAAHEEVQPLLDCPELPEHRGRKPRQGLADTLGKVPRRGGLPIESLELDDHRGLHLPVGQGIQELVDQLMSLALGPYRRRLGEGLEDPVQAPDQRLGARPAGYLALLQGLREGLGKTKQIGEYTVLEIAMELMEQAPEVQQAIIAGNGTVPVQEMAMKMGAHLADDPGQGLQGLRCQLRFGVLRQDGAGHQQLRLGECGGPAGFAQVVDGGPQG